MQLFFLSATHVKPPRSISRIAPLLASALLFLGPLLLHAQSQSVDIAVVSSLGQPLSFSAIDVSPGQARFTSEAGHYSFSAPAPGKYRIRVKHLGFSAVDTTISVGGDNHYRVTITMRPVALHLNEISVRDNNSCARTTPDAQLAIALDQLQQNAERDLLLRTEYPFSYQLARKYDTYDPDMRMAGLRQDTAVYRSLTNDKYEPGQIVRRSGDKLARTVREVRVPTLEDLADPVFLRSHCFSFGGLVVIDHVLTYRIDFQPGNSLRNAPDFAGSAYLDTSSYMIKRADFTMTNSTLVVPPVIALEVSTTYKEIFRGVALFDHIRSVQQVGPQGAGGKREQVDDQQLVNVQFDGDRPSGN